MIKLKDILIESSEEKAVSQLDNLMGDFAKAVKNTDMGSKETNEALGLTIAGVVLSAGEILDLIGKFINLLSKIPGLKFMSGDKLIKLGEKYHHEVIGAFEYVLLKPGIPKKNAHNFAEKLHILVVAGLLFYGVGDAAFKFAVGNVSGGLLKAALTAVKGSEIDDYVDEAAKDS